MKAVAVVSATTAEKPTKRYPRETKGFVEEMRFVAMKLHSSDQAKEGEKKVKEPEERPVAKWDPSIDGYLRFLVDSKLVYDTLEGIIAKATFPSYAEFKNTGLERSENLAKDLDWFKEQGYDIPQPSSPGVTYAQYLEEVSEKDPQAFICHFYNIYFAHSAGGRIIGRKVAEKILNKKELEFYRWDGDLSQMLQNVREKLNKVAGSREEPLLRGDREIIPALWTDSATIEELNYKKGQSQTQEEKTRLKSENWKMKKRLRTCLQAKSNDNRKIKVEKSLQKKKNQLLRWVPFWRERKLD